MIFTEDIGLGKLSAKNKVTTFVAPFNIDSHLCNLL